MQNGFAYTMDRDVVFPRDKLQNYGQLSGQNLATIELVGGLMLMQESIILLILCCGRYNFSGVILKLYFVLSIVEYLMLSHCCRLQSLVSQAGRARGVLVAQGGT